MSHLWALFMFLLDSEHCLTILSRPVFERKNKRVFRQIGLMFIPEMEQRSRRTQRVRIDIVWLEGSYEGQLVALKCHEVYHVQVSYSREKFLRSLVIPFSSIQTPLVLEIGKQNIMSCFHRHQQALLHLLKSLKLWMLKQRNKILNL
jgi:hypothetical protein